jgi:hypothetical protein
LRPDGGNYDTVASVYRTACAWLIYAPLKPHTEPLE